MECPIINVGNYIYRDHRLSPFFAISSIEHIQRRVWFVVALASIDNGERIDHCEIGDSDASTPTMVINKILGRAFFIEIVELLSSNTDQGKGLGKPKMSRL
jgi:hypothetical protein